jgi:adenine-specific DNA methylase
VLNAKGGEIKAKANGLAITCLPLVNFENNKVRTFDLSKILLLQNLVSCGGEF